MANNNYTVLYASGVLYKTPNANCFCQYNKFPLLLQLFAGWLMLSGKGVISSIAVSPALRKQYIVKLDRKASFLILNPQSKI